ncbi:SUKH-4 family immunity protein [Nocardiopsis trehalosi]|uniref:SUKH-4 family immunity protein n=1 Tax=Nocardiopsis trehalosi TaxID=109329 RepID=UPI000834FF10|nr:SUKH-4 family immunity protein [Nocardiopsis trehalosi]
MITREQAAAIADAWLNGTAPGPQRREPRLDEFDLGWIVSPPAPPTRYDPATGHPLPAEPGGSRGVVDRRTGEVSVWPMLSLEQVAQMYRDRHGPAGPPAPEPPAVGSGNMVVFTYRDASGAETYANGLSGPGTPPPEFRIWQDLRAKGVRADDVVAVHSDLAPADLPGAYRAKFLRETFRNAALSYSHDYGLTRDSRAAGTAALAEQADTMRRLTGGEPRPHARPVPPAPPAPAAPVSDAELGTLLDAAFPDVRRHDPAHLAATPLPEAARATLATAGLPAVVPFFFAADTPANPPIGGLLTDAAAHLRARGTEAPGPALDVLAHHVRIGSDGGAAVTVQCVGAEDGTGLGQVWSIDVRTGIGRFVNRSVAGFGRCLAGLAATLPRLRDTDPHTAGGLVAGFQDHLAAVDPAALGDPENWWSVVVEQMWDGLL